MKLTQSKSAGSFLEVLVSAVLTLVCGVAVWGQSNPVPLVNQPLIPEANTPGGEGFTLTVNGTGFVSGSMVDWNGSARNTTFISTSQLTAAILASDIATAGTASVTVVNPNPGGGTSNPASFGIATSVSPVFLARSDYGVGPGPLSIATADFNGDGRLDLAVVSGLANSVSVLLGNGDGTFQPPAQYATGSGPAALASGDFNGDGKVDLAVVDNNCVSFPCAGFGLISILLGNGDGTFQSHLDYSTGGYNSDWLAVGDFNGDGKLDLAAVDGCGTDPTCGGPGVVAGEVSVLLGNGDGTLQSPQTFAAGLSAQSIVTGDFNRDGKLDLAIVNYCGSDFQCLSISSVSILLGNGDGSFQPQTQFMEGRNSDSIATADVNGDGALDLVIGGQDAAISLLIGNGDGTFHTESIAPLAGGTQSVTTGDFNGDGKLDLAASTSNSLVSIFLGNGDGTFQARTDYPTGNNPFSLVAGDFNGDGRPDLATADQGNASASVLLQTVGPAVTLAPTSLTFGTQLVGTPSRQQASTLTNTGNDALSISSITVSGDFAQKNTCGSSVAAGGNCTVTAQFKPKQKGTRTGTVGITDNAPGSPQTVSLTGTGTIVKLSPTSLNFGSVPVGTTSPAQTVTLTNVASVGAVSIGSIVLSGHAAGSYAETNTCGASVPPGGSCAISVTFTPKAKGLRQATLNIFDNGGASPQTVAVSGTGT